jgi:hypothetical protein
VISYVDTSLLLKLYIEEPDSYLAFQWLEPKGVQPMISTLSEVGNFRVILSGHGCKRKYDLDGKHWMVPRHFSWGLSPNH